MAIKKNTKEQCGAPKLKELPAEFTQQISASVDNGSVISNLLRASLPELAKQVGKGNSYNGSIAGSVKALNLATSLDLKAAEINDEWNGYGARGFRTLISDSGLARSWRAPHANGQYDENMETYELYESFEAEIHVVFRKKLKDKKFLASKGVK